MSWLLSTLATVVGWLPGWLVLALVASVVVAGWLSGGFARVATILLAVAAFAALGGQVVKVAGIGVARAQVGVRNVLGQGTS